MTTPPTTTAPRTVAAWSIVITELEGKRQAARDRLTGLRQRKEEISLQAALGDDAAKKELREINNHLMKAQLENEDWDAAILKAEAGKRQAEAEESEAAERERRARISDLMAAYLKEVRQVDATMKVLASHFTAAARALDGAGELMQGDERRAMSQLTGRWGPTTAAGYFGLDKFIELGVSGSAAHTAHRKSFADFVHSFVSGWITAGKE